MKMRYLLSFALLITCLKRREQCVRIDNSNSSFKILVSGVPQSSVIGPILFDFFQNELFLFIKQNFIFFQNYARTR